MGRPFEAVLIANRGEIAVRIIRACRKAGLRSIAIYSDADASALHVREADAAHRVGPPPPAESYLNGAAIIQVAQKSGAGAIHPGYGFLSESADFAELCQQAGLVWIGPPPGAMRLLGDKAAAKALAERVGVPILPGYHDQAQDDRSLTAAAESVGYPLMVKATSGGGGRGMRTVGSPNELPEALAAARREAQSAFGDDRLLLERYLERPRHVEMQILGDEQGTILYLGERDCSIQRRHQKVIEEAPAPGFSDQQCRAMGEASIALAAAAGFVNAGTVEFLLDQAGAFYFLEVNARLQVEHPVTEMVTGLDLVQLQVDVAQGKPLPLCQNDVHISGHAIECRLYAEDWETGFLPSTGVVERLRLPAHTWDDAQGDGARVDAGVGEGETISTYYDSLLAKIIVHQPGRAAAVALMGQSLQAIQVTGIHTNLEFLESVVATPAFASGEVHTEFLQEQGLAQGPSLPPVDVLIAAVAAEVLLMARKLESVGGDPWQWGGPWRLAWVGSQIGYSYKGKLLRVGFTPSTRVDEPWSFDLPGRAGVLRQVRSEGYNNVVLEGPEGVEHLLFLPIPGETYGRRIVQARREWDLRVVSGLDLRRSRTPGDASAHSDVVTAPMTGRIVKLMARAGDRVNANQRLLILEAMKIEHIVVSPRDGVVKEVRYLEGDQVELGAELVVLEET